MKSDKKLTSKIKTTNQAIFGQKKDSIDKQAILIKNNQSIRLKKQQQPQYNQYSDDSIDEIHKHQFLNSSRKEKEAAETR